MILILSGNDAQQRMQEWASKYRKPIWFSFDDINAPSFAITNATYNNIAVWSEWTRYPNKTAKEMIITDLKAFRTGGPAERHPVPQDIENAPWWKQVCDVAVFASFSRLYNQVMVDIGLSEETEKFGYPLAAEALTHVICNLRDSNKDIGLIAHESYIGKRIVPHIPKSVFSMASLYVQCDRGKMVVLKSALKDVHEGYEWSF